MALAALIGAVYVVAGGSLNDPALLAVLNPIMLTVWMLPLGSIVGRVWNLAGEGWRDDDVGQALGNVLGQVSFVLMLPGALAASFASIARLLA